MGPGFTETLKNTVVHQHWKPPPPIPDESLPSTRIMYSPGSENVAFVEADAAFANVTVPGPLALVHRYVRGVPGMLSSVADPASAATLLGSVSV